MGKFRLVDLDRDSPLAIGLIMATAVVFQQPLRYLLNSIGAVEQQYHLDLLPALVVLSVVFTFHQYRKRQESRAVAMAADTAARIERSRVAELNELVAVGQSLANSLDIKEIEQAIWRHLPSALRAHPLSIVMRSRAGWRPLVQAVGTADVDGSLAEGLAAMAAARFDSGAQEALVPVVIDGHQCVPVCAGGGVIGVAILQDTPETRDERLQQTLAPVLAFVGVAIRNVQLLADSKEDSVRDSLTRWFNRGHALEMLRNDLRRAVRSGHRPSIVMFDLDGFKMLNDTLGHLQGDATLQKVARTVGAQLRGSDVRCRYGGDEFLIILPETPLAGAAQVAEHVREAIRSLALSIGNDGTRLTCSVGVAGAVEGELEPERLIARADAALYQAKRAGRNRVVVDDHGAQQAGKPLRLVGAGKS